MKRKRAAVLNANQHYQASNVIKLVDKSYQKRPRVQLYPKNLNQEDYLFKLNDPQKMIVFATGPAGTGKTTLAKLLVNELEIDSYDVMYTNGSKEARKVEWVDKLINFCQTMPFGRFKIVLIDEADYMNPTSVQPALRNLMEDYSQSVRFILTCNYPSRIIAPLHSRCQGFHITKTDHTEFTARAATVLVTEGVEFDLDILDTYVKATYPDLRKCLNLLQPNSQSGSLAPPAAADKSAKDWKLDCVELFKAGRVREARTVLCQSADAEESNEIIRWMYDNLELFGKSKIK